jgi:hypothetical protein
MNDDRRWISRINSILSIILPRNEAMNEYYRQNLNNLNQSRSHSRFSRFHFRPHSLSNSDVPISKHRQRFNTYTYINAGIEKREEMKMNRSESNMEHGQGARIVAIGRKDAQDDTGSRQEEGIGCETSSRSCSSSENFSI